MSAKSDSKSDAKTNLATSEKQQHTRDVHGFSMGNFKPYAAPRRKAGLRDDQISISKHSIAVPLAVANKLGSQGPQGLTVALLWSDADKAIAIRKTADGDYKLKQVGKLKSTRSVYCKGLIEAKKIKKGRYTTQWDEKDQMLIARVA